MWRFVHDSFMILHDFFFTCSWFGLVHDLFMTCLRLVHEFFITCSWHVHHFFMTRLWPVHNSFTTSLWLVHNLFMTFSWLHLLTTLKILLPLHYITWTTLLRSSHLNYFHYLLMICSSSIFDLFTTCLRLVHEFFITCL